jgi:hypothetical protein
MATPARFEPLLSAHGGAGCGYLYLPCPTGIFGAPDWVCPAVQEAQGREATLSLRR